MTCMGSITAVAKQRPVYMARVIQGFEMLHGKILHRMQLQSLNLSSRAMFFG